MSNFSSVAQATNAASLADRTWREEVLQSKALRNLFLCLHCVHLLCGLEPTCIQMGWLKARLRISRSWLNV